MLYTMYTGHSDGLWLLPIESKQLTERGTTHTQILIRGTTYTNTHKYEIPHTHF